MKPNGRDDKGGTGRSPKAPAAHRADTPHDNDEQRWQARRFRHDGSNLEPQYVRQKLGHALSKKSGWFLLGLAFVVVYREVFETILFFAAIWNQGSKGSVMAGGGAAAIALVAVGWAMMRYSRRLPIGQFFRYSSILIAVLAVVLIGKSVSALQEAGYLPITWWEGGLRVELIGLYPTVQGVAAQAVVAVLLLLGFLLSGRAAEARR